MKTHDEKPKADEATKAEEPLKAKEAPKPAPVTDSNIPDVGDAVPTNLPDSPSDVPARSEFKGKYKNNVDGLVYALAINEDSANGRTHHLLNSRFYDNCTKEDFKQRYEKE